MMYVDEETCEWDEETFKMDQNLQDECRDTRLMHDALRDIQD
jgi:hypothetical protein